MAKQITLSDVVTSGRVLTESEQSQMLQIFGKRAHAANHERLKQKLSIPTIAWSNHHGYYSRVHFENDGISYCAGQDYRAEIAMVRNLIIGG